MAQRFPPSSNDTARAGCLVAVVVMFALASYAVWLSRSDWSTGEGWAYSQTIPFSHVHHVGEIGIDCRYCHRSVATDAFAGIPATEVCMHCHSQLWTHAEMLAPVRESYASGTRLRWRRVNDLPDFVYFDHSAHVHVGIDCTACHGDVASMPLMRQAAPLSMRWCIDCHGDLERRYALPNRTSCSTCHR